MKIFRKMIVKTTVEMIGGDDQETTGETVEEKLAETSVDDRGQCVLFFSLTSLFMLL